MTVNVDSPTFPSPAESFCSHTNISHLLLLLTLHPCDSFVSAIPFTPSAYSLCLWSPFCLGRIMHELCQGPLLPVDFQLGLANGEHRQEMREKGREGSGGEGKGKRKGKGKGREGKRREENSCGSFPAGLRQPGYLLDHRLQLLSRRSSYRTCFFWVPVITSSLSLWAQEQ